MVLIIWFIDANNYKCKVYAKTVTAQKMKFTIKGFYAKCDHIYWINP